MIGVPSSYRIYGMTLRSEIVLPELAGQMAPATHSTGSVEFRVTNERFEEPRSWSHHFGLDEAGAWLSYARLEGGYFLRFHGQSDFLMSRAGSEIVCARAGVPEETIRHLLLDQVLPLALNVRGRDALHATAVMTPRGVAAFLGPSGSGKSTLAASFARAGHRVLSDDCLPVAEAGGTIHVGAGYPGVRLLPDAVVALAGSLPSQPVAHDSAKQRLFADVLPCDGSYPLASLYLLSAPSGLGPARRTRLTARETFRELLSAMFRLDVEDRAMIARQFGLLSRIAETVPAWTLVLPRALSDLSAARALVLDSDG